MTTLRKSVTLNPGQSKEVAFQFTPSEAKIHSVLVNGLTGSFNAIEAPVGNWLLPTGHNDPGNDWKDEFLAYDGDTNTYAENWTGTRRWSGFIELTIPPTLISAIRHWATSPLTPKHCEIDVYSLTDGDWLNVHKDSFSSRGTEAEIPGGARLINKARMRFFNNSYTKRMRFRLLEFEFWGLTEVT